MIAYGIATSFQVLSNLSNTSVMTVQDDAMENMDSDEDEEVEDMLEEEDAKMKQEERFKHLFDGERLPPKKLTVNYLMEVRTVLKCLPLLIIYMFSLHFFLAVQEVIDNIPSPLAAAQVSPSGQLVS